MEGESEYILQKVAELLLDESLNVKKQAENTCLSCTDNERNLLIDHIIAVFKSNWSKKPFHCSFIGETLSKMNKKERFAPSVVKKCLNLLLVDIFPKFTIPVIKDDKNTDEITQSQENEKFIESLTLFGQSFTCSIEGLELFFSILFENQDSNLLNNAYSLLLLQKAINGVSLGHELANLLKKYYNSFIYSFGATLSSNNDLSNKELTKLYENVVYSLDQILKILSQTRFHIANQEESNMNSSLNEILKSVYSKLSNEEYDNNFRMRTFDLTITSSKFLSADDFLANTQSISDSIINFILMPINSNSHIDKKSALILLALYNQIKETENNAQGVNFLQSIPQNSISKVATVILNFLSDNKQFSEIAKQNYLKAFLLISSSIEKICPDSILEPSLKNLNDLKNTFETQNISCFLIINKLVEDKLVQSPQKVKEICQLLSDLCNKSKVFSNIEATIYMFKLWTSLSHFRMIPSEVLKTSSIFRAISAPVIAATTLQKSKIETILSSLTNQSEWNNNDDVVNLYNVIKNSDEIFAIDFLNKILLQIAETSKIPDLLNVALEPKYILAAPIAFSCMGISEENPTYSKELDVNRVLIPRAFVYASCPFFSIKTRSDIVKTIGRLNPITQEIANQASKDILEKNCRSCCQRIVNKLILDSISQQNQSSEIPPVWIQSVLNFLDLFQKTQHPNAQRNDPTFPISYIKAAVYSVMSTIFTLVKNTIGTSNVKPNPQEKSASASTISIPTISDGRPLTLSSLFQPLFTKIFGANLVESANFITNLVEKKYSEQDQKSNVLRNASCAASVSLMLLNPDYFDNGKKLAEIIFNFRNSSEEFPLTFYCSSEPEVSEEFVLKLFNCLKYFEPWNQLVIKAILLIAKDPRFEKVIASCTDEFLKIISQLPKASITNITLKIASILYEKDKFNYVNKMILSKLLSTGNQFASISVMIEDVGPTIFTIAMKHKIEQPLYANVLNIIRQTTMPDNIQLSSIIFIIFTISQLLSSENGKIKNTNKNDTLRLFDDCVKSMKVLSSKYPLIELPKVQKVLNQTKEWLANGSVNDLNDEEKCFNVIRTLFSVCPNEITIYHISFFTEISPVGAIAGYTEMINQGRPLLTEILSIGEKAKKAALFAIPNLKLLGTERYGEAQLGQLFDFVLDNLSFAPAEGFNCILQLFDWLPKNVLFDKCDKMFINTQKVFRKIGCVPLQSQDSDTNLTGRSTPTGSRPSSSSSLLSSQKEILPQNVKKPSQNQLPINEESSSCSSNNLYNFNIYDIINGLNCLTRFSDSLTFSSRQQFKDNLPYYLVYSYCYSSIDVTTVVKSNDSIINNTISSSMKKGEPFIVPAARKALLTLCQFSGMAQTAQLIQKNLTIDDEKEVDGEKVILKNRFLVEISKAFVQEMELRCLDAAFTMIDEEQRNVDVKIAVSFLICAALHEKKGLERNLQLRFIPLLSAPDNEKLKMGILRAIKCFPVIL